MVNVYDLARDLAAEMKASEEYTEFMDAKVAASVDPEVVAALNTFQEKQFEIQRRQLNGEEMGPEIVAEMTTITQPLLSNPLSARYLQAQIRYTMMVNEIFSILNEVVKTD